MEHKIRVEDVTLERVILTGFREAMYEKYFEWFQDEEIRRETSTDGLTKEEVAGLQEIWSQPNVYSFIICNKDNYIHDSPDKSMIGDINIFIQDSIGEINIMIAEKSFRRKGIASEVLAFIINFSKTQLHLLQLIAKINSNNTSSIKLFQKFNFSESARIEDFDEVHLALDLSNI